MHKTGTKIAIGTAFLIIFSFCIPFRAGASTIIDTSPYINNGIAGFGHQYSTPSPDPPGLHFDGLYTSFGQIVAAPANGDLHLQSFTFYVRPATADMYVRAGVFEWTGRHYGQTIYFDESPTQVVRQGSSYQAVTVFCDPFRLSHLSPGQEYLLALFPDKMMAQLNGDNYGDIAIVESADDAYQGGGMKMSRIYEGADMWLDCPTHPGYYLDLAFRAEFVGCDQPEPVPEPATMVLLGSGLLGIPWIRKRFKGRRSISLRS